MRRVVVTGMGIISSIGNSVDEVAASLKAGTSGISPAETYTELGFRSQIHGMPDIDLQEAIDKRQLRFMGDGAAYNYLAMEQAIADSGLEKIRHIQSAHRSGHGLWRAINQEFPICAQDGAGKRGTQTNGTVHGYPLHEFHQLCLPCDPL